MGFLSALLGPLVGGSNNGNGDSVPGAAGGLLSTVEDDVVGLAAGLSSVVVDTIDGADTVLSQGSPSPGAGNSGGTGAAGSGSGNSGGSGGTSSGGGTTSGGTTSGGTTPGPLPPGMNAPVAPTGSDVSAWSNYTVAEEQYNEILTMFTQAHQDDIQTTGSDMNSIAQTATSIGQESMGTSIAASTARSKDVDSQSQEVTQA
jgi:hypothetical protein